MKVRKRPSMFPELRPIGCARVLVVPPQAEWMSLVDEVGEGGIRINTGGFFTEMRAWVIACTEAELCGLCDRSEKMDAASPSTWVGAKGSSTCWCPCGRREDLEGWG